MVLPHERKVIGSHPVWILLKITSVAKRMVLGELENKKCFVERRSLRKKKEIILFL